MKAAKRKKLENAGFKVGTAKEFLNLSNEDVALIELKVLLVEMLKDARRHLGVTQHDLAKLIESSQSRVAKIEAADPNVSLDLICRALFSLGISQRRIGKAIAAKHAA